MGHQILGSFGFGSFTWLNARYYLRSAQLGAALCATFGAPSGAHAEAGFVISNYDGRGCANANNLQPYASISGTGIKAGSQTADVICPIVKNTSGPNINFALDGIDNVKLSVDFTGSQPSGSGTATCTVRISNSNVDLQNLSPVLSLTKTVAGTGALTFIGATFDSRVSGFWAAQWYTDVECKLSPGTLLQSYVVREFGSQQSSYIFPSSSCGPGAGNTSNWFSGAGITEAREPSTPPNSQFSFTCPFGANRRNTRVEYFGFENLSNPTTVRTSVGSVTIPSKGHPDFPFMATLPAASGTQFSSSVDVLSTATGDGILVSYRLSGDSTLKVDAGGSANAPFSADTYSASNATPIPANVAIDTSRLLNPAPDAIYRSNHLGAATYTLSGFTPAMSHNVRLHFIESFWTAAGKRKFNVKVNTTQVLTNYDIFAAAGARYRAIDNVSSIAADANGQYKIVLTNVTDQALLAGIEIY